MELFGYHSPFPQFAIKVRRNWSKGYDLEFAVRKLFYDHNPCVDKPVCGPTARKFFGLFHHEIFLLQHYVSNGYENKFINGVFFKKNSDGQIEMFSSEQEEYGELVPADFIASAETTVDVIRKALASKRSELYNSLALGIRQSEDQTFAGFYLAQRMFSNDAIASALNNGQKRAQEIEPAQYPMLARRFLEYCECSARSNQSDESNLFFEIESSGALYGE